MDCGETVNLCGVLALESGLGPGAYEHSQPSVHGLWPEDGSYGSSDCVGPSDGADPTRVYTCYAASADDDGETLSFEVHEWEKHGRCAGAADADDYFAAVCALATAPVGIMTRTRADGGDLDAMKLAVEAAGFQIFDVDDDDSQLLLSACASPDLTWHLAPVASFPQTCGGWPPRPKPTPTPAATRCEPNQHGPPCRDDDACLAFADCLRCAHSGYCTSTPMPTASPRTIAAQTDHAPASRRHPTPRLEEEDESMV